MIGTKLGKWVLDAEIGRGGMGRVYKAHEEAAGGVAAIKVLAGGLSHESGFLQRFQREIEVLEMLNHPNIVRFYEPGTQDEHFYYAMEYVEGQDFEQILHSQGRIPWKEVLDAALQICPALKHAHDRGVIHRDLKPPNILRNNMGVIKLTDFGIAKVFAARHLTNTGGVVGTAEFLSPEQAAGKETTRRSDLYSLGVVMYTLLVGKPPFEGKTTAELLHKHLYSQFTPPQRIVSEIPHDLSELVCKLLEKDPAKRPNDALALQRQLDSIRRKMERKFQQTLVSEEAPTVAENRPGIPSENEEGPATLMSRLMREELHRQNQGTTFSQFLNRPIVLFPLFFLVVGLIVYTLWPRSKPSAESVYEAGAKLMSSTDPRDWTRALRDHFDRLDSDYPDHPFGSQVSEFRQTIEDQATLRQSLGATKSKRPMSEGQRFYMNGLRAARDGNYPAAGKIWRNVVNAFQGIETESRWVKLAQSGLEQLKQLSPPKGDKEAAISKALAKWRELRAAGKNQEADEMSKGLAELYQDDSQAEASLKNAGIKTGN